jgi:hypothetical protein
MTGIITQDNLFRPPRSRAETKAEMTDHNARGFIEAEAKRREAKTIRLRQARLANEAKLAAAKPPAKQTGPKVAARRARSSM